MRKFAFRLESILRLRTRRREEEENRLFKLFEHRERLKREAAAMQRERSEAVRFVSEGAPANVTDLRALAGYSLGWQARAVNLRGSIEQNERSIQEQSRRVLIAQQQEKVLTKLRDKQFEEWRQEVERRTQADGEEAWILLWGRRDKVTPT